MDSSLIIPITILLLIALLFVMVALNKRKISVTKKKRLLEDLYELKEGTNSKELAVRRDSIIKLDNLLSKSLQVYFKNKSSCGDNLKNVSTLFRKNKYNEIWEVHKMRNKIVHDDYDVSEFEAKRAFEVYKFAILKILQ
jgi:hypothetical protein